VTLSRALQDGIAADGGLYVPELLPRAPLASMRGGDSLAATAEKLLQPFFAGDPLAASLPEISREAFDFPAPLVPLAPGPGERSLLELFHGPTAAFKDLGARFLAACLSRIPGNGPGRVVILVATSGDTGGAVAAAFHGRSGFRVVLLYPAGRVSPLQERQLTCWGGNVESFAVRGSFDDCQRLAKAAFADAGLRERLRLSSANSINIGRLLPQSVAFASASLRVRELHGRDAGFIVPSGNLGHAVGAAWAREMGLPIGGIVLAHNANRTVPDCFASGRWQPRPSLGTIANAMDVGDPSNMERLRFLVPDHAKLTACFSALSVDDDAIRARIVAEHRDAGVVLCPHSAVAAEAWHRMPEAERRRLHWVLVATAHPAKFPEIVEPLIGRKLTPPPPLARLLGRPLGRQEMDADLDALRAELLAA
jgi:threonine synthase